jgi:hypothetical protein
MSQPDPTAQSVVPMEASDEVLRRILERMEANDASDAPDLASAIAAVLASRLEGTPVPTDVQALLVSDSAEQTP